MKIIKIKEEDKVEVAKLLNEYWKDRNMNYDLKWIREYIEMGHKIEIKEDQFFVLKEKQPIGCISVIILEVDLAELRDLVIKKEFRNMGYGSKLLDYALEWCKEKNVRKIISLIFPQYKKFFENKGFLEEGFLKNHFKEGENLILMSKLMKKDKQINLKSKLESIDIEDKTAEKLRNLPVR